MGTFSKTFTRAVQHGAKLNQTPDVPTSLLAVAASSSSITLTWFNGEKAQDGISIERSLDGLVDWAEIGTETGETFTDTTLTANHYFYRIRAYKGIKFSDYTVGVSNYEPLCLFGSDTISWYDYQKTETITKDESNLISALSSRVGSVNLSQATESQKPLLEPDGILFVDDRLKSALISYSQPFMVYMVAKQLGWTEGNQLFSTYYGQPFLTQSGSSPGLLVNSGKSSSVNNQLKINQFGIIRILFNGVNSKFIVNDTAPITGDFGAGAMQGITIGGSHAGGLFSNIKLKEQIFINSALSTQNENDIYDYVKKHNFDNLILSIIGDSIVATEQIMSPIASFMDSEGTYYDISHSGDNAQEQSTLFSNLQSHLIDVVFILVGHNDIVGDWATQVRPAYQALVTNVRNRIGSRAKIILNTLIPCNRAITYAANWGKLNEAIKGEGIEPITGSDGFIDLTTTALNAGDNTLSPTYDSGDNLHENDLGRQLIADLWDAKLIELGF